MTTATMTLTEFLLARIAEVEQHVEFVRGFIPDEGNQGEYIDPARVLAECAAKRRIVEWAAPVLTNWPNAPEDFRYVSDDGLDLLKILAAVHADHPDYRDEWRP